MKSPTSKAPAKTTGTPTPTPASAQNVSAQRDVAMESIREAYLKNFAALAQANQTLTTGAASVFQRQQDLLRNAMVQASAAAHERITAVAPPQCPEAIDRHKQALDAALTNVRQIAELAERAKRDAFDSIHKRMSERFQERIQASSRFFDPIPNPTGAASSPKNPPGSK